MKTTLPYAVSWFLFEDNDALERSIKILTDLNIPELRTAFSWADWERPRGREWFDHFIRKVSGSGIRLLPCLFYTPYSEALTDFQHLEPATSYPPKRPEAYAEFTAEILGRYGDTFEWIQFWNESNWNVYWNWEMDPGWNIFAKMLHGAIPLAQRAGKKIVLGGLSPYEAQWVDVMFEHGIMQSADALGIHAFPGTWDEETEPRRGGRVWHGLENEIKDARAQLHSRGSNAEIWLTETGYSTYGQGKLKEEREQKQIEYFEEVRHVSAERVYWHTLIDQKIGTPTDNELTAGLPNDIKAYHFGVVDALGKPKPLYEHWKQEAE